MLVRWLCLASSSGKIHTEVVPSTRRRTLDPIVRARVEEGSAVNTDALPNYWSMLKRMLRGTYISTEPWHLFRYLNEHCFRFNSRKLTDSERFQMLLGMVSGKRLTYNQLITEDPAV